MGDEERRCRDTIQAQVIGWMVGYVARGELAPAFQGMQPRVVDVMLPDVFTERLRLIPYTARRLAAAACDHTALAALLGVQIHQDWPYPAVAFDNTTDTAEASVLDWLPELWALLDPASAPWRWMIVHREANMLIGEIGTSNPPKDEPGEDSIQISYSLVPEYRRHGYMTEAASAYVAWAFTQPHLTWIYATTERENRASRHVLEKIGARPFESQHAVSGWIDWEILPEYLTETPAI